MSDVDLAPIGNCAVSALVDRRARLVWACLPRVDGDPVFSALLGGETPELGFWEIELIDCVDSTQHYERNTPILVTRLKDRSGGEIEIVDFSPRYHHLGRTYRPTAFARIVRPIAGLAFAPGMARNWGERLLPIARADQPHPLSVARCADTAQYQRAGFVCLGRADLSPGGRVGFFFGPDEPFSQQICPLVAACTKIRAYWAIARTSTPLEWQNEVIRAAITLSCA